MKRKVVMNWRVQGWTQGRGWHDTGARKRGVTFEVACTSLASVRRRRWKRLRLRSI